LGAPKVLTIHNDQIYWTDWGTSKIQRADLNLGLGDGTSDCTLQIGANNSTDDRMIFGIDSVTTDSLLLADTDVDSLSDAQTTINSLDAAIDFINDQRSNLGAVQNHLGFANSNLMSSIQNTESSLSTIRDADFVLEASNQPGPHANTNPVRHGYASPSQPNITEHTVITEIEFNSDKSKIATPN